MLMDVQQPDIEREVTALYHEHAAGLLQYAKAVAGNADEAHDGVQEVFLRYFTERRYGREIHHVRAWLFQVLRNYLLNRMKAASNREVASDLDALPSRQQSPEAILGLKQLVNQIDLLLTPRESECLLLRTEGLSYEEIGDRLDISIGTVGTLLTRAYRKIVHPVGRSGPPESGRGDLMRLLSAVA